MKKFAALPLEFLFAICTALLVLAGCTADYDTFGASDYHKMNEIGFEEFLSQGADSYEYDELDPNTAYTVIAVAMGTLGTTNGAVAKYDFSTPEIVAEKTEDITLTNARMNDACDAYGWWQMMAANTDSTTYITISPNEAAAVEGSYSIDDMDADYTYILLDKQDQYNRYCYERSSVQLQYQW